MQKKQVPVQNKNRYQYSVEQNLKDAGCSDEMVEKFMLLQDEKDIAEKMKILSAYRKYLLDKLHKYEKRIDCLDYLIYQLQHQK